MILPLGAKLPRLPDVVLVKISYFVPAELLYQHLQFDVLHFDSILHFYLVMLLYPCLTVISLSFPRCNKYLARMTEIFIP